ncbi:MAG: STAS domain-containing protein [Actinomycetota bacterium]
MLKISRTEDARGLRLAGEVDLDTVDEFSVALEPEVAEGGDVTLDLSDLRFLGSSGVQVLIRALVSLEGRGRLVLLRPIGSVRRLLQVMDLRRFENLEVREGT